MNFKTLAFGSLLALGACQAQTAVATTPAKSIRELIQDDKTVLVDVRVASEYEEETAPGAINIPVEDLEKNLDVFKNAENVVVFCNRGIKADRAMEILKKSGIKNAYDGTSLKQIKTLQAETKK